MSNSNNSYWYKRGSKGNLTTTMPNQAIPRAKKDKQWKQDCMDTLERIGIRQTRENARFTDFYRMIEGKLSMMELSETVPHLKHLADKLKQAYIPSFLKHYDILGIIVNAMVGELSQNGDKFVVTNTDEIGNNEYVDKMTEMSNEYLQGQLNASLEVKLAKLGYNTNLEEMEFESEEQQQQYVQQLEQARAANTPDYIEKYLTTDWKTDAILWGEYTLDADRERFYMSELDRINFTDYLLTGRMFRHPRLGYDYYDTETWSPINTFFSQDLGVRYVQNGEYVGRVHYHSPNQMVNRWGQHMSQQDKERILSGDAATNESYRDYSNNGNLSFEKLLEKNFGETNFVPFEDYFDWEYAKTLEHEFGTPMGERTTMGKDGKEVTVPTYLPNRFSIANASNLAHTITTQDHLRTDLIQVTEAYWVSYKTVGIISYETESGSLSTEIVTEDLLYGFIKSKGIKQLRRISLEDLKEKPLEPNTIVWDYIPEVWQGKKARAQGKDLSEDYYFDIKPLDVQIKGNSNIYDVQLPVCGIIDSSMGDLILPFQLGHNIAMNQLYKILEKELGIFFLFDFQFLPSEFKEWGDTEETLLHVKNFVRDTGLFPVDFSKQNLQGQAGNPTFAPQNLSMTAMIQDRLQLAEAYKAKAFEQIGVTPQRLGAPTKYETKEGVQVSQKASYSQTEKYYERFNDFLKRYYEMHLTVAQQAQIDDKDISVYYTKSNNQKAYLKFADPSFPLRHFGIMPISNARKREELASFKNYLMQTNTLGEDTMAVARLTATDTMSELIDVAREERKKRQEEIKAQRQHESQLAQMNIEGAAKEKEDAWKREEYSNAKDRENRILVEQIQAMGRAADKDANQLSFDRIDKAKKQALEQRKQDIDAELGNRKLDQVDAKQEQDKVRVDKEFDLRYKELQERATKRKSDEYQSMINKN